MEYSTYSWNLVWSVWGVINIIEYSIKMSRTSNWDRFALFLIAFISGIIGGWNLICLLVKLNAIHP
jgi:hypothetical protein